MPDRDAGSQHAPIAHVRGHWRGSSTAEAISTGRKVDSHAEATDRYRTLEGALACLIKDCGVQGLTAQPDETDLFDGP